MKVSIKRPFAMDNLSCGWCFDSHVAVYCIHTALLYRMSLLFQNSYHDLNQEALVLKRLEDQGAILYLHPHS